MYRVQQQKPSCFWHILLCTWTNTYSKVRNTVILSKCHAVSTTCWVEYMHIIIIKLLNPSPRQTPLNFHKKHFYSMNLASQWFYYTFALIQILPDKFHIGAYLGLLNRRCWQYSNRLLNFEIFMGKRNLVLLPL